MSWWSSLLNWVERNSGKLTVLGALIVVLPVLGINPNLIALYRSLDSNGKNVFVLVFNTLLTVILFSIAMGKRNDSVPQNSPN
ncbi:MAG: hypothetical protein ACP5NS_02430 [Candidatus Pacearchaeota archaeon]